MNAINKALNVIPIKREMRYIECNDYTYQEIVDFENQRRKEYEKRSQYAKDNNLPFLELYWTQIVPGLWDLNDPENINKTGISSINGIDYLWSYWTKTEKFEIRKAMEYDLENNKIIGNWYSYK